MGLSLPLRKCGLKLCTSITPPDSKLSLPLRKCGLKWCKSNTLEYRCTVTSLAEVWIEIALVLISNLWPFVTSLAEVWIEIIPGTTQKDISLVTSLAEVWIEIDIAYKPVVPCVCHFPCGSVD